MRSPLILASIRAFAQIATVLLTISACSLPRQQVPKFTGELNNIHERLAQVVARSGFQHGMHSKRIESHDADMIYIVVSLDSLKRRHSSLDKLLTDIGTICALPDYAHLPIRIVIGAKDKDDRKYMSAVLATPVNGKSNIDLFIGADSRNDITITVRHPSQGGT